MNTHAALPGEPTDWYYLLLEGEPASAGFLRSRDQAGQEAAIASARARAAEIADQHEALGERLRALNVTEAGRFCRLVNAVRVKTPPSQLPALRALPGVRRVERIRRHERHTSTSVPFIGATALWSGTPAADGMGVRIGIVDSGIDYTHAHFGGSGQTNDYVENDPTQIESGTFPTAKVSGGFDFVGDDYNAEDPSRDFPQPDPDPLDCAANGHGTHVAGIAAGFGVLANGTTYTGPYTSGLNLSGFAIGPGVAPNGLLYALKVFGCSGTTRALVDALEYASDPDGDFDFSDRLDVVNVSLGSPFGLATPEDAERNALNQLVDLGCVVVTSAGNTGEPFYSLSSPGVAEKGLTVANSIDDGTTTLGVEVLSPEPIAAIYDAIEGIFTSPLAEQPPIEAELVWVEPGDACESISNPAALAGKVALIDRGTCLFVDKIQRAQDAGAVAVVMVNNVSGAPIAMGGSSSTITIPGVMISQADGALIKEYLSGAPVVRLSMDTVRIRAELADQLDGSSSRGPSSPGNQLKPEIAAPGHSITSAQAGAGGLGEMMTGTSMAAPHVAGAAALLRQLHPEWLVEDIKAALMNTAQPTRDAAGHPYPQSRTGAGRVQPEAAARAVVTAKAAGAAGLVAMSFGALELTAPHIETRNVVLVNHGSQPVSYTVTVTNSIVENGVALTPLVSSVTVPANGSINVPVQLTANPAMFDRTSDPTTAGEIGGLPRHTLFEASGEIWFLNPNLSIHLPFYVNVRAAAAFSAATPALAVPFTAGPAILALPMSGASAHPQALISAFQLGAISGDQSLTAPQRQGVDLLAVGAASDIGTKAQLEDATVYFGIGVVGNRTTPVGFMGDFYVLIDTNYDGTADCWLENFSAGNNGDDLYTAESANDVFMTVLSQESTSVTNSFLNVFPADQRDTAPFNNGVMVMPVTVKALGLTPGRSGFRYRVVAYGAQEERYPLVDETDWIDFDAARPLVDTAVYGMGGTPFFDAGPDVRVRVDRTAAAFNGFTDPEPADLLLLHHFNTVGNRVEVVDAQYTPRFLPPEIQPNGIVLSWPSASNQLFTIRYTTQLGAPFGFVAGANLPATPPVNTMLLDTSSGDPVRLFRLEWQ